MSASALVKTAKKSIRKDDELDEASSDDEEKKWTAAKVREEYEEGLEEWKAELKREGGCYTLDCDRLVCISEFLLCGVSIAAVSIMSGFLYVAYLMVVLPVCRGSGRPRRHGFCRRYCSG